MFKTTRRLCGFRGPALLTMVLSSALAFGGSPPGGCNENPFEHLYYPDNGQGTVNLPPNPGPGLIGPINLPIITNGLNAHDSIILIDINLLNMISDPMMPGGSLGGDTQHSHADTQIHLGGTGTLSGWELHVPIRVDCRIDASPRPYFGPLQSFDVRLFSLQGNLTSADFDNLQIHAGDQFGLPSPALGHVNLVRQPDGTYAVDLSLDMMYRIDYVGSPTGVLAGRAGSQTATQHIQLGKSFTWTEESDALQNLPGQMTSGSGSLGVINGTLTSPSDVDLYCIHIDDAAAFSASTVGGAAFDTQLFLFNANGMGVTHNDDAPTGGGLQSRITGQFVPGPGYYFLAISGYNRDPLNPQFLPIWNDQPDHIERPPDGPGAPGPLAQWQGNGFSGNYAIQLAGCSYCDVPPLACWAGDPNHDGRINGLDIQGMVNVELGIDADPRRRCEADVFGDGLPAPEPDRKLREIVLEKLLLPGPPTTQPTVWLNRAAGTRCGGSGQIIIGVARDGRDRLVTIRNKTVNSQGAEVNSGCDVEVSAVFLDGNAVPASEFAPIVLPHGSFEIQPATLPGEMQMKVKCLPAGSGTCEFSWSIAEPAGG